MRTTTDHAPAHLPRHCGPRRPGQWVARLLGEPIAASALALFFDRLAVLVSAGRSIDAALLSAAPTDNAELAAMCARAAPAVAAGTPLHRALEPSAHRLPPIVLPVLEVGEVSGTLDGAARRLADAFNAVTELERKYRAAAFSPWLAIAALSLYAAVFASIGGPLAAFVTAVRVAATLTVLLVVLRIVGRALHRVPPVRRWVDALRLALPGYGAVARDLAMARWGRSYAALWNAGVPPIQAIEVSARSTLNGHYEEALHRAALGVQRGEPLSAALEATALLPPYLVQVVRTAEESGSIGPALERLVEGMERDALSRANRAMMTTATMLQVLALIAAAASLRVG